MKRLFLLFLCSLLFHFFTLAQVYTDYIGGGHSQGITVTTSDNLQEDGWNEVAAGEHTLSGAGLEGRLVDASRFLAQATFGVPQSVVEAVAQMDFEDWISQQAELPPAYLLPTLIETYNLAKQIYVDNGGYAVNYPDNPDTEHVDYAWWQLNMTNEDLLRQRVAFALSEIFVVSTHSDLEDRGEALADYYDVLIQHALGNYKDLLLDITLHPSMGVYLSHLNNPRSFPEYNIHPDQNYAREVMQLFSIGLFELNQDGSRKTDEEGNFIPTYDNEDIKELAKVFTGLGAGGVITQEDIYPPQFNLFLGAIDFTVPMAMYEDWHEPGEKHLLNGFVIPAGQSGMQDIEMAVEHLYNHPNIGPFISRQLIQRLVKSNPSPEYIFRVAEAFNDNGSGVRGDMKAVITAILLDEEARTCEWLNDPFHGRLREPITRYTQFAKAVGGDNQLGLYWNDGRPYEQIAGQHPLHSPSVFNFFLPDFQPNGPISALGLVAPEFQIHNTRTSIGYLNFVNEWTVDENLLFTYEDDPVNTFTDFDNLLYYAKDPDILINKLDVLLTNGQLTEETRQIIKTAIEPFNDNTAGDLFRLKMALYLFMISPDYNVMR
jgi:uncharacterized protein (DUF1800 family)